MLVEKEQVALLAEEAVAFLDRLADDYPELPVLLTPAEAELREPTVPLFRARLIGLGFDPERELVLLELRERPEDEAKTTTDPLDGEDDDEEEGYVARIYATRAQVRAMAARGVDSGGGRSAAVPAVRDAHGPRRARVSPLELTPDELGRILADAELEVVGRMRYSSNATFLVEAKLDDVTLGAVYKPQRGERPLWDFAARHAVSPRGRGLRAVARAGLGDRAAHHPARRPARRRARCSGSWSTTPTSTTSR